MAPVLLLAAATALTILSLSAFQSTDATAGPRLLGRLFAAMVELDRWLPAHRDDIQTLARERERGLLVLEDLPMYVPLRGSDILAANDASLKRLIRNEAGRQLYNEGIGAFQAANGATGSLPITEPARWTIALYESDAHGFWAVAAAAAGLSAVFLALVVLVATIGNRARSIAVAAGIGAVIALVLGAAFWGLMTAVSQVVSGLVNREIALIMRDSAWIVVRNSFAVLLAAVAVYAAVAIAGRRPYETDAWPGAIDEAS